MMEMDNLPNDDGPPPLSPHPDVATPNKVVDEDDSLGYKITVNECDEESDDNSSASQSRTATPVVEQDSCDSRDGQPSRLKHQKITADGGHTCKEMGEDSKFTKDEKKPIKVNNKEHDMNGVSQSSEEGEEVEENDKQNVKGKKGKKANGAHAEITDDSNSDHPNSVSRQMQEEKSSEKKELHNKDKLDSDCESSVKNDASEKTDVQKKTADDEKNGLGEENHAGDKKNTDQEKKKEENGEKKSEMAPGKENNQKSSGNDKKSPIIIKETGQPASASVKLAVSGKTITAGSLLSKMNSMVLDARTGVTVNYIPPTSATSLLTSTAGVRLLLPSGAPGQVMYIPNSGTFLTSTGTTFPATSGMVSLGSSTNPILIPAINAPTTTANLGQSYFVAGSGGVTAGVLRPPVIAQPPPKLDFPTSSKGMIDMIKWETENHFNIKPKYVKPNPKAELGNLAKWLFDLGSDLVKEFVYHDLVKIQKRRKDDGNLSEKEKSDFNKLQEIDEDLNKKIGHLKFKLNKSCKCGFRADLASILYLHREHAHHDRGGFMSCCICRFSTRQPSAFRFHMEAEHSMCGRVENRPSFFECSLCPYESNYPNRLDQHKTRCQRQFREAFNLHPSCMSGPEVNLCLENVFYYVFTRQFLNTITPPISASTSAVTVPVASSTTFRDLQPKSASQNIASIRSGSGVMGKFGTQVTVSSVAPQQLAVKNMSQLTSSAASSQLAAFNSTMSRNFPIISSQIGGKPSVVTTKPKLPSQSVVKQPQTVPQQPNIPSNTFEVCEICGGYVKDRKALRIHFFYAHRIDMPFGVFERAQPPLYCATCFARFWTAQGLQKHIEVHKADLSGASSVANGVAGKCISCGHRVPNILMHMRMVHNRELRHYLAALMCIFCGNRFSSKHEVEEHMGSQHGVVVRNSAAQGIPPPLAPGQNQLPVVVSKPTNQRTPQAKTLPKQPVGMTAPKPGSKLNRGSQCVLCNVTFQRNVDLTRHCMRVHHTCMKCGLVVVDKESLNRHTCLHSAAGMRTCQICGEKGFHPAYYIKHMRDKHLRRCSVVLRRIDRATVETFKRPITISDSEDDDVMIAEMKPSSPKRQKVTMVKGNSSTPKLLSAKEKMDDKSEKEKGKSKPVKEQKPDSEKAQSSSEEATSSADEKEKSDTQKRLTRSGSQKEQQSDSEKERTPSSDNEQLSDTEKQEKSGNKSEEKVKKENGDVAKDTSETKGTSDEKDDNSKSDSNDSKNDKDGGGSKREKTSKADQNRDRSKKKNDRKRKSDELESGPDSEDCDDVPYSKRLRRSSRTNSDVLELD